MKVRLAYRASEHIHPPCREVIDAVSAMSGGPVNLNALKERLATLSKIIRRSTHVCLDNVARHYAESNKQFEYMSDIPNWAPPFRNGFYEWNEPESWNFGNGVEKRQNFRWAQMGAWVASADITTECRKDPTDYMKLMAAFCGLGPHNWRAIARGVAGEQVPDSLNKSRWLLQCELICAGADTNGACFSTGINGFLFIGEDGRFVNQFTTGITASVIGEENLEHFLNAWKIIGLGTSFMHCKNVIQESDEFSPGNRWHSQTKVPRLTFRTLRIEESSSAPTSSSDRTGESQRALHICRGHFAKYTDERPLFGRYTGTFWRPDHTRGNSQSGVVEKDYAVT